MTAVQPVVLCGGRGTRLWPASRRDRPKPFLSLDGGRPLLDRALARARTVARDRSPWVLGAVDHRFLIAERIRQGEAAVDEILLEPAPRGTAAAVAAAVARASDDDTVLVLLPADHRIADEGAFADAIHHAVTAAEAGHLVVLGVEARHAATGYGWITAGAPITAHARHVRAFHEKPDADAARAHLAAGDRWNAGVFVGRVDALRHALSTHAPDVLDAAARAVQTATRDLDFLRLGPAFSDAPAAAFDRAVLERTDRAAVVALDAGWDDIGTWEALREVLPADAHDNRVHGRAQADDATGCVLHTGADGPLVIAHGVHDLVVAATPDAVLVTPRDRVQDVGPLVDRLAAAGLAEVDGGRTVHRPWGTWTRLHTGDGFLVKSIRVAPGRRLSLQRHQHRDEHWIVVRGTAHVERDGEVTSLTASDAIHVPAGTTHRLTNPGPTWLELIEVQTGDRLDEADIDRVEDDYGR